ncbi:MAG: hypothetical protein MJD61_03940 [Proteobacteria bacterium]|nr:hypothetical protein [Pseudomonadota bacterium]
MRRLLLHDQQLRSVRNWTLRRDVDQIVIIQRFGFDGCRHQTEVRRPCAIGRFIIPFGKHVLEQGIDVVRRRLRGLSDIVRLRIPLLVRKLGLGHRSNPLGWLG